MSNASHCGSLSASRMLISAVLSSSARAGSVATDPFFAHSAGLRLRPDPLLVDHRVELLAHPTCLRLPLDLVAVNHPAAIRIRAGSVAARHRACRLLRGGRHDLERANTTGRAGAVTETRLQADARSVGRDTPVGRKWNQSVAIRTGDSARPEEVR